METAYARSAAWRAAFPACIMILGLYLSSCGGPPPPEAPKAPPVTVGKPVVMAIRDYTIFTGKSQAFESADVKARVSGLLETVEFEPSKEVKAGDKLILLESMKMIIPIQAPQDGLVTALHCSTGEAVQPGEQLIELEEDVS